MKPDPIQAFALAFCGMSTDCTASYWFLPGDELYERWRPAVEWGLNFARALIGKKRPIIRETAEAMMARPLIDGARYAEGHLERWMRAVSAMIEAARQAKSERAREQGRAA